MKRGPDVTTLLLRALTRLATAYELDVAFEVRRITPWASVTFTGVNHELRATAKDHDRFAAWLNDLPEADLALRGHTADVTVDAVVRCDGVTIAMLAAQTIEDC